MKFSHVQLETLWVAAGGDPRYSDTMAAIAQAESGGDPNAVNTNTNGTKDRGLWQINDVWGARSTFDVIANARAAVYIQKKQGLSAWATYNAGKHTQFLTHKNETGMAPADRQGWLEYFAKGAPSGKENPSLIGTALDGPGAIVDTATSGIHSIGDFLAKITSRSFWLNAGKIVIGLFALMGGAVFIGKEFARPMVNAAAPIAGAAAKVAAL